VSVILNLVMKRNGTEPSCYIMQSAFYRMCDYNFSYLLSVGWNCTSFICKNKKYFSKEEGRK